MANPRVNILIANYNYGEWILDAIDSCIAQTYPDIMLTIVDDNSTDDSWQKVYKQIFQSRTHNKILPSQFDIRTCNYDVNNRTVPVVAIRLDRNYGPSFARNTGISATIKDSDFFMILDADDKLHPNKIIRCVQEAMKLPQVIGIVYADYMTLNVNNGLERIEYKKNYDLDKLYSECIIHSGSLISKPALEFAKNGNEYYDSALRVCEDYDLWLRITRRYTAKHIPECLTLVRVSDKNSTSQIDNDTRNACMNIIRSKMQNAQ